MKKKLHRVTMIVILVGVFQSPLFSQAESDSSRHPVVSLASAVIGDVWHVASAIGRISSGDALKLASFSVLNAGLVYGADAGVDREFALKDDQSHLAPFETLADVGAVYDQIGTGRIALGVTAGMLAGGIIFKDRKSLQTARLVTESVIIAGLITYWSKGLFGRSRPYTDRSASDFDLFKFSSKHESRAFPSGHSTSAFSIMTVIARQYPQWWVKYPAYTVALGVALQRMSDRQHWTSDVVVGGAIGYWVGRTLTGRRPNLSDQFVYAPFISGRRLGVRLLF